MSICGFVDVVSWYLLNAMEDNMVKEKKLEHINDTIDLLKAAWLKNPDLRFMELMDSITRFTVRDNVFRMKDSEFRELAMVIVRSYDGSVKSEQSIRSKVQSQVLSSPEVQGTETSSNELSDMQKDLLDTPSAGDTDLN